MAMRRRRFVLAVALAGAAVAPGSAQVPVHPCDVGAPTTQTVSSGVQHKASFCAVPTDNPEALTVYVDGTASDLRPVTRVTPTVGAGGRALYEGPRELVFPTGEHVVEVALWNVPFPGGVSQEGPKSSPLSLSAVVGAVPPAAPTGLKIVR